jgi:HlyD family secretion protein
VEVKTIGLILVLAVIGVAASGEFRVFGKESGEAPPPSALFKVARGDLSITIEENGYLTAKNNSSIKPKFEGQGTITWLIDEGKEVEPDEVLVEFDKTDLENRILELENSLVQYEIELEAARAALEIQERDNAASIEKAELALQMAQLTLERYEKGDQPNELRKQLLATEKATSEFERATERFEQVPELVKQGFLTRIQEEEERIRLREAEINKENAERDLELLQTYTQRMDRTQKETAVKDAERELENARQKAGINLKERQASLAQRERQVTTTKQRLEKQREELANFTIKAEKAGIVHYGDPARPWYREQIKVGNTLHRGTTVLTIPDLSEMQVLVNVHEADIELVKKEMPVLVMVETRKEHAFPAKITEIATVASTTNWTDESNKSFRVEILLDPTDIELRAGVTAKAEIQVETLEDVLHVPIHAVVSEGGKHLCFLWKDGAPVERAVEIGKNNAHYVEIVSGLEQGEQILLYDPRSEGGGERSGEEDAEAGADEESAVPVTVSE